MILANARSGGGRTGARLKRLLERVVTPSGVRWRLEEAQSPDQVREVVAALEAGELPVAAGGDGTINMLAGALHTLGRWDLCIGVLPTGTANLLARDLGLSRVEIAVQALVHGTPRPVDVMLTDRPDYPVALVSISAGFDGAFMDRYERGRRLGRPVGAFAGASAGLGRWKLDLVLDGEDVLGGLDAVTAAGLYNTRCYGPGATLSPGARPDDGVVEAVVFRSPAAYWGSFARAMVGGDSRPRSGVIRRTWRKATLRGEGRFQIDGERLAGGEVNAEVVPGRLQILAPATR